MQYNDHCIIDIAFFRNIASANHNEAKLLLKKNLVNNNIYI